MSIRKYLLISILLIMSSVGGLTIWSSYTESRHEVQELFDAQLARSARLLLSMAVADIREGHIHELQDLLQESVLRLEYQEEHKHEDDDAYEAGHYYETKLAFQVWDRHGNMLLRSANSPLMPFTNFQPGFSDKTINEIRGR